MREAENIIKEKAEYFIEEPTPLSLCVQRMGLSVPMPSAKLLAMNRIET
jgi:hypothetical protein